MTPEQLREQEILRQVRHAETIRQLGNSEADRAAVAQFKVDFDNYLYVTGNTISDGFIGALSQLGEFGRVQAEEFQARTGRKILNAGKGALNFVGDLAEESFSQASALLNGLGIGENLGRALIPDALGLEPFLEEPSRLVDRGRLLLDSEADIGPAPLPPIDAGRNFIDPSDPIQQIPATAEETVVNNGLVANEGVAAVLPLLGPVKRPEPSAPPPSTEGTPARTDPSALSITPGRLPNNPFDQLLDQENTLAAAEAERLRLRAIDEQAILDGFTSNITQANGFSNALNDAELANTLALDEYGRRVLQAGLIGTAETQSSQQLISRLAGLPGLGGEISAIAPALAQANPVVNVPSITPGIRAQASTVESNFRQNNAASANLRAQLSERVRLQNSLRTDLQRMIAGRLRGE